MARPESCIDEPAGAPRARLGPHEFILSTPPEAAAQPSRRRVIPGPDARRRAIAFCCCIDIFATDLQLLVDHLSSKFYYAYRQIAFLLRDLVPSLRKNNGTDRRIS
jgi:hypothetical protein